MNSNEKTRIYLVTNCYEDPNKIYIGKEKYPKTTKRLYNHRKRFGKNIYFGYIDEINSLSKLYWEPLETFWIEQFRQWGFDIQNKNNGGGGVITHNEISKQKIVNKISKSILQYDLNGNFIKEWNSIVESSKILKINKNSISNCLVGKIKKSNGFIWRYKNNPLPINYTFPFHKSIKPVLQYDISNKFIKEWNSIKEASNKLNLNGGGISSCCSGKTNKCGKFKWKYKNE